MDFAASVELSALCSNLEIDSSTKGKIMSIGIFLPITPVDAVAISVDGIPVMMEANSMVLSQSSIPSWPVKQFAFPLFTTTKDIFPPFIISLVWMIGAATTLFDVKTAEAALSFDSITAKPYLPSRLPAARTPSTAHIPPSITLILDMISPFGLIKIKINN